MLSTEVKALLIFIIIFGAFWGYRKLFMDYHQQKEAVRIINARKKRVENSEFQIEYYIKNKLYIKPLSWKKQKNKGIHPCEMNKKIRMRDYSKGCKYVVKKKGL